MTNDYIWCGRCEAIRPQLIEEMPGTDESGDFTKPTDLMCGECRLVIATTYKQYKQ